MGKLKKWQKSEKSKVQLKKKLPKGLNITDTTFKTKQIVVPDQLKTQKGSEPVSNKNLTIKELITRLNHHNEKACQDALLGLKELISSHPEVLLSHFQNVITSVCKLLISDVTRQIRHDALKLLRLIFTMVNIDQINPVFDILHWTLNCAMTHINMKVQEDSLSLFDILLKLDQLLVARMARDILPNFLNMISKLHFERKLERTLTVNLKNKVTSIKWRVEVLNHIYLFLSSIVSLLKSDFPDSRTLSLPKVISLNENSNFIPIYSNDYGYNSSVPHLFRRIIGKQKISDVYSDLKNIDFIKNYIQQLFPLIFETWLEVGPGKDISEFDEKACLSKDAADVLKCVLNILQISWDYIYLLEQPLESNSLSNWLKSTYSKEFISYFVQNFPYVQGDSSYLLSNNTRLAPKHQVDYRIQENDNFLCMRSVEHNLIVSHLFVSMCSSEHPRICNQISNYIQVCMKKMTGVPLPILLKVLECLLRKRCSYWITCKEMRLCDVLRLCIETYFTCGGNSVTDIEWKRELFRLLCQIMLDVRLSDLHNLEIYSEWLASLPALLCVPVIPIHVVDYLAKIACLKNECFQENFIHILPQFIKILGTVIVDGAVTEIEGRNILANFFYWVHHWNDDNLQLLKQHMSDGSWDKNLCDHVTGILYHISL